jgi:hypothetical protein
MGTPLHEPRHATYHVMRLLDNHVSVAKVSPPDIRMQHIVEWPKQTGTSEDAQRLWTTISISRLGKLTDQDLEKGQRCVACVPQLPNSNRQERHMRATCFLFI